MTPATIPDVQSNDRSPSTHKCVATILVEHAVSIEKEGPRKPYMKDTRCGGVHHEGGSGSPCWVMNAHVIGHAMFLAQPAEQEAGHA